MQNYFSSLSNRTKAIYLIWIFLNFVLLLLSGNLSSRSSFDSRFFPFKGIDVYDYSEFFIYTLTPIIIYFFYKLWNNDRPKSSIELHKKSFFINGSLLKIILAEIPIRTKAVYLSWIFIHFILFMIGGNLFTYKEFYFPFNQSVSNLYFLKKDWMITFSINVYDYSEFFIYALTPVFIYFIYKLWKIDSRVKLPVIISNEDSSPIREKEINKIALPEVQNHIEFNKSELQHANQLDANILADSTALILMISYVVYLFGWTIVLALVSAQDFSTFSLSFFMGQMAYAWVLVLCIGLYRKIRKKKPTIGIYIFYFFWTTGLAIFILISEINMARFLQNH